MDASDSTRAEKVFDAVYMSANGVGRVLELGFLYAYVPLIIYWGSQTTEHGLLGAMFPPAP